MKRIESLAIVLFAFLLSACSPTGNSAKTASGLDKKNFETTLRGKPIALYTLTNSAGMELSLCNYGARIVSLMVPDRNGKLQDVVLGFDNIQDYLDNNIPFGATVGRNANRTRNAQFAIDGVEYKVDANDGAHSLHGGSRGWQSRIFEVKQATPNSIEMQIVDADGENGYPGEVKATVTYTLTEDNTVCIAYTATTTKPTLVNMTNHAYFNLSGDHRVNIMKHSLYVDADHYTPKAADNVPDGRLLPVDNTPLDFRTAGVLVERIMQNPAFKDFGDANGGYGINFALNNRGDAADIVLTSPESGISMEMYSSQPGAQFFSCNTFPDGLPKGKGGIAFTRQCALCLETQHFPNAVNVPEWVSPVLRPNEVYRQFCNLKFTAK